VIAKAGSGSRETFTVRRIVAGEGVERKFPLHSPKIATIQVTKLYYLRDRSGKATRLREKRDETGGSEAKGGRKAKPSKKAATAKA